VTPPIKATSHESDACLCKVAAKSGLGKRLLDDDEGGHMNIAFNGRIFAVNGSRTLRCNDACKGRYETGQIRPL